MNKFIKISDHVYILPYNPRTDRPIIAYIKGSDSSLLFDLGTGPKTTSLIKKNLKDFNLPYPDNIILSHFHWDHSFGSGYFKGKIHASEYTDSKIKEMIDMNIQDIDELIDDDLMPLFCKEHLHMEYKNAKQIKLRRADNLIKEETIFNLGDVNIKVIPVTSRHCEGNLILLVEEDKILFVGDADSGYVKGYNFYDNREKYEEYFSLVKELDFEEIIFSHIPSLSKNEFLNTNHNIELE